MLLFHGQVICLEMQEMLSSVIKSSNGLLPIRKSPKLNMRNLDNVAGMQ